MSPTPYTRGAILLLSAGLSVGGFACLEPGDLDEPTTPFERAASQQLAPPAAKSSAPAAISGAPSRSFVAGELLLELEQQLGAYHPIELNGVRLVPVEQLQHGAWRVLLPAAARAHAAVTAGQDLDEVTLAAAEQLTLGMRAAIAGAPGVREVYVNGYLEYSAEPTDPFYQYQRWHYAAVRLPAAWNFGGGSASVRLAIIDSETAANQHPDLAGKWSDSFSFTTAPQTYHHGAHVAGIAGGAADGNQGVGVCWSCRLLPYRMDRSFGQIGQAINRAAGEDSGPVRAEVINLSLNRSTRLPPNQTQRLRCSDPEASPIRLAIARAIARGVTVVVSAGNFGHPLGDLSMGPAFPADCDGVISVAATQPGGAIAEYSNRDAGVTLAAPGGGGLGLTQFGSSLAESPCPLPHTFPTDPPSDDPFNGTSGVVAPFAHYADPIASTGYCYRYLSGTSMSAPHVTGTVGLMKSRNSALSPAQVKDLLIRTAQPSTNCPFGPCGAGLLDAHAATRYAPDGGVPVASLTINPFGDVLVGSQAERNEQLLNNGSATLIAGGSASPMRILGGNGQIEFAYPSGPCASGITCAVPVGVAAGTIQSIPLRCRPTSAGLIVATLQLPSNGFNSFTGGVDTSISTPIFCTGALPPDIEVRPSPLHAGAVQVGSSGIAYGTIYNPSNTALRVTQMSLSGSSKGIFSFACDGQTCAPPFDVPAGSGLAIAIRCTPTRNAPYSTSLVITSNAPGGSTIHEVQCQGLAPGIAVTPSSGIDFGTIAVGATATATVGLHNVNAGLGTTLAWSASVSAGPYQLSCISTSGCSCAGGICSGSNGGGSYLQLAFSPAASNAFSATLTVLSNDPDQPVVTRSITGSGSLSSLR